ncbi:glutamate 5-kinase, partial [Litorivivens sp.]
MTELADTQRWVIKIGSALLTANGRGLWSDGLDNWVRQMVELRRAGHEVLLVSSGAVAEGMTRLGWSRRPEEIHRLQAAAAVGQMGLVQAYESRFSLHGLHTAQILLGHDDISARDRYLNARGALQTLLELGVIPVVNENDTVVTDEIRFGDNDTLAALVANLVDADVLVILTDQKGLFTKDPRNNPDAELIAEADASDTTLDSMVSGAGVLGRGGMITKLRAARLAARAGADTVIASGVEENVLPRLLAGDSVGTRLRAKQQKLAARKQWLAGQLQLKGQLQLDDGAVKVLTGRGSSLLPVGVKHVSGSFHRGDLVSCVDLSGREIARGLVNYNADEA